VEGPGTVNFTSGIRIVNVGATQTRHARVTLHNATDGTVLGTWDSGDVAPHASVTVATTAITGNASLPVSPNVAALTLIVEPHAGLRFEHIVRSNASGAIADLTDDCRFHPAEPAEARTAQDTDDTHQDTDDTHQN
jgi:hypothetical protein